MCKGVTFTPALCTLHRGLLLEPILGNAWCHIDQDLGYHSLFINTAVPLTCVHCNGGRIMSLVEGLETNRLGASEQELCLAVYHERQTPALLHCVSVLYHGRMFLREPVLLVDLSGSEPGQAEHVSGSCLLRCMNGLASCTAVLLQLGCFWNIVSRLYRLQTHRDGTHFALAEQIPPCQKPLLAQQG